MIYYLLFVAHNAAGGFLAVLCAFSLALSFIGAAWCIC